MISINRTLLENWLILADNIKKMLLLLGQFTYTEEDQTIRQNGIPAIASTESIVIVLNYVVYEDMYRRETGDNRKDHD